MRAVRKPQSEVMHRTARSYALLAARSCAVALAVALAGLVPAVGAAAATMHASDKAMLHYVEAVGERVYETGGATGTLPGSMHVHMVFGSTFIGSFTIFTHGGSISGRGRAKPHGEGVYESFAGTLVLTGGTGRYRHAHGTGHLYGTFDRNDYALTIKTAGTLHY